MSADQDDSMLSDDDDVRPMLSRFTSARGQSIPSTARSEPTKTSTMASSPQLPLTSDVALTVTSTPSSAANEKASPPASAASEKASPPASAASEKASPIREHILKMRLASAKQNAQFEREERLRIRKARTGERKEIVVLKAYKKELYGRLQVKDTELKQKDVTIAHEQDLRATLSREHDQLVRELEAAKKNLRSGKTASVKQVNEKNRETQKVKAELAKRDRETENLKDQHARESKAYTQEIGMLKAQCAKEKAGLNGKSREIDKLKAQSAKEKAELNKKSREIEKLRAQSAKEKAGLNQKSREIDKLKAGLAEKQGAAAGNPMLQNLMRELQKTQASLMMPAAPPKTAERGVEMGTQTDDDGLAEKVAAMKRILG